MGATASVEDDDDGFPRPFGQYVLLENFARGGMGEVYLAKYGDVVEKYCVLKKLRKELTRDREYVTRFIDEARVVVTLNHANICHVFDVGRVGDEYYLAMEYVSGRDVRTMMDRALKREKPIPAACALQLTCETLEALDYAHRRVHPMTQEALNLVHRDVSPQNVLVSYEGEVKLIDFGLAASKLKVERTQPNVVMGKMAYMAPEQARGDQIDARADLFACGVLCYELITGERFYEGMSANDIWNIAGKGGHTPKKWETIDPAIAKILAKALHHDAKKRYANCGEFREALASEMHWRFPGSGVKSLRDVMADLFADEIAREREMLQRFGKVTVQSFRDEMESTSSHSISLAAASLASAEEKSAQLVRNEQSQSGNALMPPPAREGRDVHVEPTRVGSLNDTAQTAKARTTDEASVVTPATSPGREMTARVVRTSTAHQEPTTLVRDRERMHAQTQIVRDRGATLLDLSADEKGAIGGGRNPMLYGLGLGVAVLVAVGAYLVTRGGDDPVVATNADAGLVRSVDARVPAEPPKAADTPPPPTPPVVSAPSDAAVAVAPQPPAVVDDPAPDPAPSEAGAPEPAPSTAKRDARAEKRAADKRKRDEQRASEKAAAADAKAAAEAKAAADAKAVADAKAETARNVAKGDEVGTLKRAATSIVKGLSKKAGCDCASGTFGAWANTDQASAAKLRSFLNDVARPCAAKCGVSTD